MLHFSGEGGELRAGHSVVARLSRWRLDTVVEAIGPAPRVKLTVAAVRVLNQFDYDHDKLDLWLEAGDGKWMVWRRLDFARGALPLTAILRDEPEVQ